MIKLFCIFYALIDDIVKICTNIVVVTLFFPFYHQYTFPL